MAITQADVTRIARLARIRLTDKDRARFTSDLAKVLEFVATLNELDTSHVAETVQVTGRTNVTRPDTLTPALDREIFLQGAPAHQDKQLKVRGVFS